MKETVVEVSEAYPEELKRARARELRAQGHEFQADRRGYEDDPAACEQADGPRSEAVQEPDKVA